MNTRRKFLQQGSLATAALLLAGKNSFASSFFFGSEGNTLVILHSHNSENASIQSAINAEKRKFGNMLLVDDAVTDKPYSIVQKGNTKTGIINGTYNGGMNITEINEIAGTLKEEKNCDIVICISEFGYDKKNKIDDQRLARSSRHIDIIIGNDNTPADLPSIILNKDNQEVLINHCSHDSVSLGRIEIHFDEKRLKKNLAYSNLLNKNNKEIRKNFSLS